MRRRSPASLLNYVPQCSCALRASCIASSCASHASCLMSCRALHCFKNWSFPLRISSVNVIWSHLMKKSLMENFFFCAVLRVLCLSCSLPSPASWPTCSRALRLPCLTCLVLYVPRCLMCLVPYMFLDLVCSRASSASCFICSFMPYMLSCLTCLTYSCASRVLCFAFSRVARTSCHTWPFAPYTSGVSSLTHSLAPHVS